MSAVSIVTSGIVQSAYAAVSSKVVKLTTLKILLCHTCHDTSTCSVYVLLDGPVRGLISVCVVLKVNFGSSGIDAPRVVKVGVVHVQLIVAIERSRHNRLIACCD